MLMDFQILLANFKETTWAVHVSSLSRWPPCAQICCSFECGGSAFRCVEKVRGRFWITHKLRATSTDQKDILSAGRIVNWNKAPFRVST